MFEIIMLPASEGDCFVIRYGDPAALRQILVDVGRKATYKKLLKLLPAGERHFELFVITHVDRDHIEGALALLTDETAGFTFDDIWFNAYRHLVWTPGLETFGPVQGEKVTTALIERKLAWNKAFAGGPVRIEDGPLVKTLEGGMALTLLSPDAQKLAAFVPEWQKECRKAGIDPAARMRREAKAAGYEVFGGNLEDLAATVTSDDGAAANGSSIAFIAEYAGRSVLFAADAHPGRLLTSLTALGSGLKPLTAVKVAHHGSKANTTAALMAAIDSSHFLISTNGSYFDHPDDVAIARLITAPGARPRNLYFNYDQDQTAPWGQSSSQKKKYGYICHYPAAKDSVTRIDVAALD